MPYEVLPLCANRHLHQQFNAFLVASVFNQLPFVQPVGNGLKHLVGELGILRPDLEAGYQVLPVFRRMKFPNSRVSHTLSFLSLHIQPDDLVVLVYGYEAAALHCLYDFLGLVGGFLQILH